ncbi:hypothetical protein FACS1894168_2430 [Deltaproteobacteria bacterium]|nr:hypothetical protein FACS1894168_2430 [Deltaproteobacteria bacterium]
MSQNQEHDVSPEDAKIAGVDPNDGAAMKALRQKLAEWDYTKPASAGIAYTTPGVERLQLLRQIRGLPQLLRQIPKLKIQDLSSGSIGVSPLYDILKKNHDRGKKVRDNPKASGKLNPWSNLASDGSGRSGSLVLRAFLGKHLDYLGGKIVGDPGKWYFSQYSNKKENLPDRPEEDNYDQASTHSESRLEEIQNSNHISVDSSPSLNINDEEILNPNTQNNQYNPQLSQDELDDIKREKDKIGRCGEELINHYFQTFEKAGEYVSLNWESYQNRTPFDFRVTDKSGLTFLLDVKSTRGDFDSRLYITWAEIKAMANPRKDNAERYDLYRVYKLDGNGGKLRIVEGISEFAQSILKALSVLPGIEPESVVVDLKKIDPKVLVFKEEQTLTFPSDKSE